jgi:cytidine deaminase
MDDAQLIQTAISARQRAYSPYSGFAVGAAIECGDGRVFPGANIENLSFGLTCCAERVAIFSAITAGASVFRCIAIAADTDEPVSPCGACRQVMAEFHPSLRILIANLRGRVEEYSLAELLPRPATGILNRPAD